MIQRFIILVNNIRGDGQSVIFFYNYYKMEYRSSFDVRELVVRLMKYLVEGLVVALAAFFIPAKKMPLDELAMIALTAAATFALLDMFAPSIGHTARQGAGLSIGFGLTGGIPMKPM